MMRFNRDEQLLMMLYCPGTREGLIQELEAMQKQQEQMMKEKQNKKYMAVRQEMIEKYGLEFK